jgi:glycosyltransferase involved in cell wall biosynthesis
MADNPLVSVLMPAYNARRYLAEAIESVLGQTWRDFELLVIDDGSTDDTAAIAKRYEARDPRIRVMTRSNGGIGAALNAGLEAARGELIARMDSDDVCLPERFARQVEFLRQMPDCVLVGSRVMLIDSEGASLFEMEDVPTGHEEIEALLLQARWSIVHPAVMMRREVVRQIGGYDNDVVPVEDHDLFLRLAEVGRLANLPEVLLRYRKHPMNSVRVLADRRVKALTRVMETAFARRGLSGVRPMPAILPDVDRDDPRRDLNQKRNWGWQCLRSGNLTTARKYALAGLREDPLALESWKLMICVLRGH